MSRQLAKQNRRIVGDPTTFRARFWSVVRCYPTNDGLVWFKETNPGHRFEAGLTVAMADLAPDHVVVPVAADPDNGWLLTNDHGSTLDHADVEDQTTLRTVVGELGRLQCTLLGRISVREHSGLLMLPPTDVGAQVRAVAHEWATLPSDHPLHAGPDLQEQVARATEALDRHTAALSDLVPIDLEINDVYPANICADRSAGALSLRFFDFGNAAWGHPFVTLHGFLAAAEEWNEAQFSPADREALYDEYLAVWSRHLRVEPQRLRGDLASTRVLVYPHRLLSWLRLVPHADPIELHARAEIPRNWMAAVAALTD